MKIPFVDLRSQYQFIKKDIDQAIEKVILDTAFIRGKYVLEFEHKFAEAIGAKHCIGVGNGTDAIYITLRMLGVGSGDEVITVANTWISTSETISQTGATPVFVDPDRYYTLDAKKVEYYITPKTKAIIVVHLTGQMAEVDTIKAICERHQLFLIEDCAQSHFSELNGKRASSYGIAATFSFYPGKNLGAYGDAGCIVTNNDELSEKFRMFANHGSLVKHKHLIEGINSRLDGMQAAILTAKLSHIMDWTNKRIENAFHFTQLLQDMEEIETPEIRPQSMHTFHLYVIKAKFRDELKTYLFKQGISTAIHYPTPLPFLPAYKHLGCQIEDFPVSAHNKERILSLPIYPELTREQIGYIVEMIKRFYSQKVN